MNFPFLRYQTDLFRNSYKLKRSQAFKRVYLVDDYTQKVQENLKEMRAVSGYAKSKNVDSKVKGMKLVIDGKAYYKEMKDLPHGLSIEAAKTIEVEDKVAFQSKHSFLSNHHRCTIKKDDKVYSSSEQTFYYTRVVENDCGGVAHLIL